MIGPFLNPVDEERDGAPDYYRKISRPIDLGAIQKKLLDGRYSSFEDFDADI